MFNKPKKYFWLQFTSIISSFIFVSLLILVAIASPSQLNNIFHLQPNNKTWLEYYGLKIFLILILLLILIAVILWLTISFKQKWIIEIKNNLFLSYLLAILTLNPYAVYFIINQSHTTNFDKIKTKKWSKFKIRFGIKQWNTMDYVLIAFFCAITLVLGYLEEDILPHLPFGGGFALKYIPLLVISFMTSFLEGWLTGFICALVSLLFIPATNMISPWSFLLDYFLPMTTPAIVAFLAFKPNNDKSVFTYINYFLHCFLVFLIIYFWQFLSGYFLWTTAFPNTVWQGYSAVLYSLIYNFIHIFIFTYPITQAIIPILYRSLGNYYLNRYH